MCFAQKMPHKWSPELEHALVEAHVELGSKWVAIARRLSNHHREEDIKVGVLAFRRVRIAVLSRTFCLPPCLFPSSQYLLGGPTRVPYLSLFHTKSPVLGPAPVPSLTPLPDAPPNRTTGTPPSAPRRPPAEEGNPPCSTPTPACTPRSRTTPSGARPSGGNCLTRPGPSAPTALTGHRATGGLFTPRCPPP